MQCRAHVTQLGRFYNDIKDSGADVIVILGDSLKRAHKYKNIVSASFPILADPEREVYRIYELEKYFMLIQRTASLVIDRHGVVRYLKRTTNPMIWLQETRELFGFVDSLNEQ